MPTTAKVLAACTGLALMLTPSVAAGGEATVTAHIKRDKTKRIVIYGRAPVGADVSMRLVGPKGGFIASISAGSSINGRYRIRLEARRPSVRAKVTVTDGEDVYKRTTRLLPAL